jgi:hypothetical protein
MRFTRNGILKRDPHAIRIHGSGAALNNKPPQETSSCGGSSSTALQRGRMLVCA